MGESARNRKGVTKATRQDLRGSDAETVEWFWKAVGNSQLLPKQGVADAHFSICGMYYSGKRVRQDNTEAVCWYQWAAERGMSGEMVPQFCGRAHVHQQARGTET